jgi:tripartite ATP-independent transporter DctM subunit
MPSTTATLLADAIVPANEMPRSRPLLMLQRLVELATALALAIDVIVVFVAVIFRYFLHNPLEWSEEVARALMVMIVFFGAAGAMARSQHVGIDSMRGVFPRTWQPFILRLCDWLVAFVAVALAYTSTLLLLESRAQTTSTGLPQALLVMPMTAGCVLLALFALAFALQRFDRHAVASGVIAAIVVGGCLTWTSIWPDAAPSPVSLLTAGFLFCVVAGVPIAFALSFGALLFFVAEPGLPTVIYAQQISAGIDHFVLLAVPFFVLAGMIMEVNGMSSRLIELLLRMFGKLRGGMNFIMVVAMAFFSGISGSKLADVAAVGGILMPAVRRTRQNPNDAAGLLAASAIMAETIPPCINMIILGFVANLSIGGLFLAGIVPSLVMAAGLAAMAIYFGRRVDVSQVFTQRRSLPKLIGGAFVGLLMIAMIGKGVTSGVATSTEISAFAVVYAIVVGWIAFRELTPRSLLKLFVDAATMSGMVMFIVAAASGVAHGLTMEQVPHALADLMVRLATQYGSWMFMLISILALIFFGAILEGAAALIIFGPLLTPIAIKLGYHPLHFAVVLVIAMGIGLFSPPFGLGMYATCAIGQVRLQDVVKPYFKYLSVLLIALVLIAAFPELSLWLPRRFGLA